MQPGLVQRLVRLELLRAEPVELYRPPALPKDEPVPQIALSEAQEQAFEGLRALMDGAPRAALLYGVTGSGKTQVYIRLIREALARGKSAILLVPEIALTPQMVCSSAPLPRSGRGGPQRLTSAQRSRRGSASRGEDPLVVGTRTAVFARCPELGVIIWTRSRSHAINLRQRPAQHRAIVAKYRAAHEKTGLLVLRLRHPFGRDLYPASRESAAL